MLRFKALVVIVALAACGSKDDKPAAAIGSAVATGSAAPATGSAATPAVAATTATSAGVEAGGIAHGKDEGAAGTITSVSGTVEIRRVGETRFAAAKLEDKLYSGDQVKSGEQSSATLALADDSVIELAEVTTIGIGSRDGTADPASSAAVLAGLARFSVASRAPGEGAFRVYTPQGVVMTKGTAYGVGVSASGEARVGVEDGQVGIVGLAALDATPVEVSGGSQATLDTTGKVGASTPWPADDWGTWRDGLDAQVTTPVAALDIHAAAMTDLDKQLAESYVDLDASAKQVATFEATAGAASDKNDPAAYTAALPEGAATIDASFGVAGRTEALTWAYAGHAALADDIYVRHPKDVEARWTVVAPQVDAAVLWPKRYEVTSTAYLEPLRMQYYVHHPRGRAHAALVGVTVPEFYAQVEPPVLEPAVIRTHAHGAIWIAPDLAFHASARPVWVGAPSPTWHEHLVVKPRAPRAKVAWYVRPPELHAKMFVGVRPEGHYESHLTVVAPVPRAEIHGGWHVQVGEHVHVAAPDYHAAAVVRAKVKLDPRGHLEVRDHRPGMVHVEEHVGAHVGGDVGIGAHVGGGVHIGGPVVRDHREVVKEPVVRDHRGGGSVEAGVKVKIHAPPPPTVKVKVKAGIHL